MDTNDHSNPPSIEATASEKQTDTTADVKPQDASLASVESETKRTTTELPPAQRTAKTGSSNAPLVSKKAENQNARKHGLYSKYVLCPWESKDDFNCLFKRVDVADNSTPPLLESPSMVPVETTEAEPKNEADAKPIAQVAPQKGGKPKAD